MLACISRVLVLKYLLAAETIVAKALTNLLVTLAQRYA